MRHRRRVYDGFSGGLSGFEGLKGIYSVKRIANENRSCYVGFRPGLQWQYFFFSEFEDLKLELGMTKDCAENTLRLKGEEAGN